MASQESITTDHRDPHDEYQCSEWTRSHLIKGVKMKRRMKYGRAIVLFLALLLASLASGGSLRAQGSPPVHKVILRTGHQAGRQTLLAHRARLLHDYGAFSLWTVQASDVTALGVAGDGISVHPEYDRLVLRKATIDTRAAQSDAQAQAGSGPQLHLVQFSGPIRDEWVVDLQAGGARVVAYVPHNGYVVWADESARAYIAQRVAERADYQWHGAYLPAYRLAASLGNGTGKELVDVVVQVLQHADSDRTVGEILAQSTKVLREPHLVLDYINLTVRLPAASLPAVAARADVFNLEPWQPPVRLDERQGQIMSGHLSAGGTQPTGAGYLDWLDGLGFPQNPNLYPIVDVIDDGFDNGSASSPAHPDFRLYGNYAWPSRMAYARDLTNDQNPRSLGSHGTINVSIVGGYSDREPGSPYVDGAGYQYGLGLSPYGRMASTKVFSDLGYWGYSGTYATMIAGSYSRGARITNNSWGSTGSAYTSASQAFDALTRDADASVPGNQEMTHVFSAGNDTDTLTSPGTAKNVISVGASENVRPTGTDGCGVPSAEADNAQDLATFSSRGPTTDGRVKPDVVAPGTHIQGAVSQDPAYSSWPTDYLGVCDRYWPLGQTMMTWSSGTSHAAPAVAGALSLIHTYLTEGMGAASGVPPSPAMLKAYLLNSTRHLSGAGTGGAYGTLPSNAQGWGLADLGRALDGVPSLMVDQSERLDHSGQMVELSGIVADPGEPFRVTLAWTDAPGAPPVAISVNDLDLEVTAGGQTYWGNQFLGSTSVAGGGPDDLNNVESVFLAPGTSGPIAVRIIARNIAGDGVPGNVDSTDQDFALVVYNAAPEPDFGVAVSPALAQVCGAATISYTVSTTALHGYNQPVTLVHSDPPPDGAIHLVPSSGVPSFDATLWVTSGASTAPDRYAIVVTGTAEVTRTRAVTVALDVDTVAPVGTVSLISPTDAITNVALRPTFAWVASPSARTYRVQVSGNAAFWPLVLDAPAEDTSYQPDVPLLKDSTYHWRVVAQNGCGSITSTTRVFTTVNPVDVFYDTVESGPGRWVAETPLGTTAFS